jgi:hypothetical protein
MVPLPPVQQLGFGTSRWWLQETLHQACAQAKGGIIFFLPRKIPLLARLGPKRTSRVSPLCLSTLDPDWPGNS